MKCKFCGETIETGSKTCPKCGEKTDRVQKVGLKINSEQIKAFSSNISKKGGEVLKKSSEVIFDDTLLYSGSYAIIGTMVIRTSYLLSDEQQVELTNDIVMELTEIE